MHIGEGGAATNSDRKNNARGPHEGRHVRTPQFPETSVGFPDPISGELPGVVHSNFSVGFMSRRRDAVIGRCGEWILKSRFARAAGRKMSPEFATTTAAGPAGRRRTLRSRGR